jgi:hypothetical protein
LQYCLCIDFAVLLLRFGSTISALLLVLLQRFRSAAFVVLLQHISSAQCCFCSTFTALLERFCVALRFVVAVQSLRNHSGISFQSLCN